MDESFDEGSSILGGGTPYYRSPSGKQDKTILDPIHGHIKIPSYCTEVMDTPQFQRLRDLKQLGTTYMVFPGASHNRFEHSLGVCHLSGEMLRQLRERQPDLECADRDVQLVQVAGLCHDLGHGPFSHAFEGWAAQHSPGWEHEHMSCKLFECIVDQHGLDYSREEVNTICDLIGGNYHTYGEKAWLFDIVSNSRNGIDVDKFDYLARDGYNVGYKIGYDHHRLMTHSRVLMNSNSGREEICFHSKDNFMIYSLFQARYTMFKSLYSHKATKAIEYMVMDAFTLADDVLQISNALEDPNRYYLLTDTLLRTIESDSREGLQKAKDVVNRIRRRQLYKFVCEYPVEPRLVNNFPRAMVEAVDLSQYSEGRSLERSDYIVQYMSLHYGMKEKNPVDEVGFYSWTDPDVSFRMDKHQSCLLLPDHMKEVFVRVFTRNPEKADAVHRAFAKFMKANGGPPPSPAASKGVPGGVVPTTSKDERSHTARNLGRELIAVAHPKDKKPRLY